MLLARPVTRRSFFLSGHYPDGLTFVFYSPTLPLPGQVRQGFPQGTQGEDAMDQKALFMKYWEKEATAMRKVISRIPQDRSDYKPDPKSRNAREIAWLIVREEMVLGDGFEKGVLNWEEIPTPATMKEILDTYDKHHDEVTKKLHRVDPPKWDEKIAFMWQGQEVMSEKGYDMAWGFLLDVIHHRGQLSTYLRPMGSTVPAIYGPSADEGM
jgi:uncharacterized damage-inducible protein DinB